MRLLEWDNPKLPVIDLMNRPLNLATALLMAREFGDSTTEGPHASPHSGSMISD
jgi:hypothetical protein